MGRSKGPLAVSELRRKRAWEMHINGSTQWDIAAELGVSQPRVCQLIKDAAKNNPIVQLSYEERAALSEAKWNQVEGQIRESIEEQRINGRVAREVIRLPDGSQQTKITKIEGVDPGLLRTLSTHIDRRNRQAQNQMAPDTSVQAVQVNVVRDFLSQGEQAGKLSPEQWNDQTVDI